MTVRVDTKSKMYPSDELTLVAEVHGSACADERYVLSAHVQEPGANDNASGVGDLSEMARVLATLVQQRVGAIRSARSRCCSASRSRRRETFSPTIRSGRAACAGA